MKNKKLDHTHDKFFRNMLTNISIAKEFFANYLPADILEQADIENIQLQSKNFVSNLNKELIADIVYKLPLDKQDSYVIVLIEHQTYSDKLMPLRIEEYKVRIMRHHVLKTQNKKLPLVLPIVVYHGKKPYLHSNDIRHLIDAPTALIKKYYARPFQLIDLTIVEDENFREETRLNIILMAMKHVYDENYDSIVQVFYDLAKLHRKVDNGFAPTVIHYVLCSVKLRNVKEILEVLTMETPKPVEEKIETIADYLRHEGMQQGMQQGRQEEREKIALNLLRQSVDYGTIQAATGISLADLEKLASIKIH